MANSPTDRAFDAICDLRKKYFPPSKLLSSPNRLIADFGLITDKFGGQLIASLPEEFQITDAKGKKQDVLLHAAWFPGKNGGTEGEAFALVFYVPETGEHTFNTTKEKIPPLLEAKLKEISAHLAENPVSPPPFKLN